MNIRSIAVGSTNPVKVAAVVEAISNRLPNVSVTGIKVESGVSEQPMTDLETKKGAINRAQNALNQTKADIAISFEGGVFKNGKELWNTVWCCATNNTGAIQCVNGGRILLPKILSQRILSGGEMGPIMDALTNRKNVKKKEGMFGVITNGWLSRQASYTQLARLAIGRLLTTDWK